MKRTVSAIILAMLLTNTLALAINIRLGVPYASLVTASTIVGGWITSNTTWTEANSPYIVTSNVLVSQGVALTIEPGVIVKFDLAKAMLIEGELVARGTEAKPIVFTSIKDDTYEGDSNGDGNLTTPAPGDWAYIFFTDPSVDATFDAVGNYAHGSILEYSSIKYSGGSVLSGAIHIDLSAPFLNYTNVSNNAKNGIYISQGTPKIANNNICNNSQRGIHVNNYPGGNEVTIIGNTVTNNSLEGICAYVYGGTGIISNNTVTNNGKTGISVESAGGSSFLITGNIIRSNSAGGIRVSQPNANITNNIVTQNTGVSAGMGGGIYVAGGGYLTNQVITNNIIAYNTAPYGGALYLSSSGYGSTLTVSYNHLIANNATTDSIVHLYSSSDTDSRDTFKYNLLTQNKDNSTVSSSLKVSGLPIVNYNNFFSNFHSYETTDANAPSPSHVDAENNWWGTSNETEIQAKIYDWVDDSSRGIVEYTPYSTSTRTDPPISPPTGLIVSSDGKNTLSWNPNLEPDLAGYKIYYDTDSSYPYRYSIDVGNVTNYTLTGLPSDFYYFTVTAYDTETDGINDLFESHESWYAPELSVVIPPAHDIAITEVNVFPTEVTSGELAMISVTAQNQGNFTETFNVTAYANTTIIDTIFDVTLTSGNSTNMAFTWNTTDFPLGTYTISAEASVVLGEIDTADNTYVGVIVEIGFFCSLTITTTTGGTTDPPPGNYTYSAGTLVNITAIPNASYVLDYWELDAVNVGATNPVEVTMDVDQALHAVFVYVPFVRDIAVTNVTPSKTVVDQSYSMSINVTVENQGNLTETFNVTAYTANTTASYVIGELQTTLAPTEETTLTFTWNTTGFAKGNYTISAYAWPVSGETDTNDNLLTDGWVFVAMPGDVNGDGIVDIFDIVRVALSFGMTYPNPSWDPNADINNDGTVDIFDLVVVALHFGETG